MAKIKTKPVVTRPERRRGALSNEDKEYIALHSRKKSVEEIAVDLNRSKDTIEKHLLEFRVGEDNAPLLTELRNDGMYERLRQEFSSQELQIFEVLYVKFSSEFNLDDLNGFDQVQLMDFVRADIREHRSHILMRTYLDQRDDIQRDLQTARDEIILHPKDPKPKNEKIKLTDALNSITKVMSEIDKEIREIEKQKRDILKTLKMTRERRLGNSIDGKRNFSQIIKDLMDEHVVRRETEHIRLTNTAAEKSRRRFATPLKFADGTVEQPLLNSDTVMEFENG